MTLDELVEEAVTEALRERLLEGAREELSQVDWKLLLKQRLDALMASEAAQGREKQSRPEQAVD